MTGDVLDITNQVTFCRLRRKACTPAADDDGFGSRDGLGYAGGEVSWRVEQPRRGWWLRRSYRCGIYSRRWSMSGRMLWKEVRRGLP